eukprot:TRINITY_DN4467_c0_g1_i3.p2 TRINITY_DN4467_c0_g1~~TRINITY_DN4467_c0_g1_i3.p2  ORF type:complete len:236 (-),score=69.63 TRINITY_DN4467_c0_g1_i3:172-879(-)
MRSDCLLALSHLTEGGSEAAKLVLEQLGVGAILGLVEDKSAAFALRVLGNVCSESVPAVDVLVKANGIKKLKSLLTGPFQEDICWIVSNIAIAGNKYLQELLDSDTLKDLCSLAISTESQRTTQEAGWAIANACTSATFPQIKQLIEIGALPAIVKILKNSDAGLKLMILKALYQILMCGKIELELNYFGRSFEQIGGVQQLENMEQEENEAVRQIVVYILSLFYNKEIDCMVDE